MRGRRPAGKTGPRTGRRRGGSFAEGRAQGGQMRRFRAPVRGSAVGTVFPHNFFPTKGDLLAPMKDLAKRVRR